MIDQIVEFVRDEKSVSSRALAQKFLKFKNPDERIAHKAVTAIIGRDRRFILGDDGLWSVIPATPTGVLIRDLPLLAIHALCGTMARQRSIYHICAWKVGGDQEMLFSQWSIDPQSLTHEEQEQFQSPTDALFDRISENENLDALCTLLKKHLPVFMSWRQQAVLQHFLLSKGRLLPDDYLLLSELCGPARITAPRPISLDGWCRVLGCTHAENGYAYRQGSAMAECCRVLIDRCEQQGVTTRAQLDDAEAAALVVDFSQKQFTYNEIRALPETPGVYAFKNELDKYLYIGKAANLKRRVLSYFRATDESPQKLLRLRAEAVTLTVHRCGSEIESLIYEHRLIKKHNPILNLHSEVNERSGAFATIDDSIILLPHTETGKGMSLWFRGGQKIMLKPFATDFSQSDVFIPELEAFFFGKSLPPVDTDFPEQEIAIRWIKAHAEKLVIVPVHRFSDSAEVFAMMRSYWNDATAG